MALGILLISIMPTFTQAAAGPDTVTIQIGQSKVFFVIENEEDLKSIEEYDMNAIIKQFPEMLDSADSKDGNLVIDETDEKSESNWENSFLEINSGEGIRITKKEKKENRTSNHFHIDFGLNNLVEEKSQISSQPYKLSNWGSRYFALSSMNKVRIGKNKGPMNFQFGAELAWNNFMFEEDITIRKIDGQSQWINYLDPTIPAELQITKGTAAKKGKLTVATIGIPLLVGFDFGKEDDVQIAAGGFVNYKIGSHTKTVYFEEGEKKRVKNYSDYGLNDFRYGFMATFSYKGMSIFGKYDVSPLFNKNPMLNGQETGDFNVYTFGIRI